MRSDPTSLRRAMITVPFRPSLRPSTDIEGSVGGSQVHPASAPAPAHTVPGSLGFAGGVLVPFAAFEVMSSLRQYSQAWTAVSMNFRTLTAATTCRKAVCLLTPSSPSARP